MTNIQPKDDEQCSAAIQFGHDLIGGTFARCYRPAGHRSTKSNSGHFANVTVRSIYRELAVDNVLVEVRW